MKEELNIAEILKDKPKDTKLYSPIFGEVKYDSVLLGDIKVLYSCTDRHFYMNGKFCMNGECLLFPSKEMRDWSKFAWKKGDILVSNDSKTNVIFNKWKDDTYVSFYGRHYLNNENGDNPLYYRTFVCTTEMYSIVNKDIAKDYISSIEEKFDGKLNLKTLDIEKTQLEFKDGDIVVTDSVPSECYSKCIFILKGDLHIDESCANSYVFYNISNNYVNFNILDTYIKDRNIRLATYSEKQQLFNTLAKKNKAWNTEKKVIEDIKTEYQFKPFEKVLVRDNCNEPWRAAFFSYINEYKRYVTTSMAWKYCVPYEGNEHLLGTTKDAEE